MTDDRSKRRAGLLADSEVIDGVERGADPDVQVLDLGDADGAPEAPPRQQGWIEGVRTTVWEGREAQDELPPALQRSKQATGSIEVEVDRPDPGRPRRTSPAATRAGPAIEARRTAPFAKIELKPAPRTARQAPARLEARPTELAATPAELEAKTGRYPRSRVERPITGRVTGAPAAAERQIVPVGAGGRRGGLREAAEELDVYDDGYDDDYGDYAEEEPAIGRVPQLEAPSKIKVQTVERISPDPRLRVITHPDSAAAEQYRVLALKLKEGRAIRRVMAVMAPNEESSGPITAANIALALAEGRRSRILMLDADLRTGELGALFDLFQGPGLAEQIRNHRRQPEQPWIALELTRSLHFLPAGTAENPASLLNSEVLGDLMAELRSAYDFIIMATPPVIESADVNILQEHVDGAVLVVKAGVTKKDAVTASIARLGGKKFLGTVLVGVK